jgi:tight adherence protein B
MPLVSAVVTFVFVGGLFWVIFTLVNQSRQDSLLRRRLEAVHRAQLRGGDSAQLHLLRDELYSSVPALQRLMVRWPAAANLRDYLWQAGMKDVKPGKIVLLSAVMALGAYIIAGRILVLDLLASIGMALACAALPFLYVAYRRTRRLRAFERIFPEAIDLLARAVRAGHAFTTGLELIAKELAEPVASEFRVTFEEQNFGLPLKDALLNLAERVPLIDVRFFVIALLIQKETGGNLAEILDNLARVIRERFRILGDVRVKTAQGRMTAGILIGLPPFMMMMMSFLNPGYIKPLFHDPWGPYFIAGAAIMQIVGSVMLWKIVHIEV